MSSTGSGILSFHVSRVGGLISDAWGCLALSRLQFIAVFRKCLRMAVYDPKGYTSHAFCIGAGTEAARVGLNDEAIKRIGRWDSHRIRLYIRPHLLQNQGPAWGILLSVSVCRVGGSYCNVLLFPCFSGGEVGLVWILGHFYVFWGAGRADVRPNGRQLGFP